LKQVFYRVGFHVNCAIAVALTAAAATVALATAQAAAPTAAILPLVTTQFSSAYRPGPSSALWATPYYACKTNYYVSTKGSDTNAGTAASPWLTLQHANDSLAEGGNAAGACVNVGPGTYAAGVHLTVGGNAATTTGYIAYRCMTLDGCAIGADGDPYNPVFSMNTAGGPNYIFIDGFNMAASSEAYEGIGVKITNTSSGSSNTQTAPHHIWVVNNLIHGFGEGGVVANESDWLFVLHNSVYNNAYVTCDAQGSGIDFVVAKSTPNYTPTADDLTWAPFHQVIAWNNVYGNFLRSCGTASNPYNTDGNGIIMDTFDGTDAGDTIFSEQSLIAYNITRLNGGKGVHIFRSGYITVANNTAFDNNLDPFDNGIARGEFENSGGFNNTWINNIARPYPATSASDPRCKGVANDPQPDPCPLMANAAFFAGDGGGVTDKDNNWSHNINLGGTPPYGWGPDGNAMLSADAAAFTCTANKCAVNPLMTNPAAANFALKAGSPAIGYGVTASGLTGYDVDVGACYHSLTTCP